MTATPHHRETLPTLPYTWRPRRGPLVAVVMGAVLVVTALGMWVGLPGEARATFSGFQTVTLVVLLLALLAALYRVARLRLRVDEQGLTIVNVLHTHRLEWAQVLKVNLRAGDPWVQLDVDDGTTVAVMAIQTADGRRARDAARQLARLVAARGTASRDD